MNNLKVILVFAFLLSGLCTSAQQATVTTGGNTNTSAGSVSYTVGQPLYQTVTTTTGRVSQGVQQPYEFFVVSGINEAKGIDLLVRAFPSPVSEYLIIKVQETALRNLNYQLLDASGKVLISNKIAGSEAKIDVHHFVSGNYLLRIYSDKCEVKVFKIIKN